MAAAWPFNVMLAEDAERQEPMPRVLGEAARRKRTVEADLNWPVLMSALDKWERDAGPCRPSLTYVRDIHLSPTALSHIPSPLLTQTVLKFFLSSFLGWNERSVSFTSCIARDVAIGINQTS
jgi:hypothetical protein